jgi:hypothetical protein
MTVLREQALRVAVLRALTDRIIEARDAARDELQATLADLGADRATAELDGTKVATLTLAGGKRTARVVDDREFLSWVREHRPGEVEQRVRDAYRSQLLAAASAAGAPVDPNTGELIPGVEVADGSPYIKTTFTPGGRERIAAAWAAGELDGITGRLPHAVEGAPS